MHPTVHRTTSNLIFDLPEAISWRFHLGTTQFVKIQQNNCACISSAIIGLPHAPLSWNPAHSISLAPHAYYSVYQHYPFEAQWFIPFVTSAFQDQMQYCKHYICKYENFPLQYTASTALKEIMRWMTQNKTDCKTVGLLD